MVSGWGAMACRGSEGGTVKTYPLLICKPACSTCDNANAQLVSCAREGWGRVKTCPFRRLDRRYNGTTLNVQKKVAGVGAGLNFGSLKPTTPHVLACGL